MCMYNLDLHVLKNMNCSKLWKVNFDIYTRAEAILCIVVVLAPSVSANLVFLVFSKSHDFGIEIQAIGLRECRGPGP